jgi:hypothetical protein
MADSKLLIFLSVFMFQLVQKTLKRYILFGLPIFHHYLSILIILMVYEWVTGLPNESETVGRRVAVRKPHI